MKKIVSVFLALLLSLSCFSVMSFAEETNTPEHLTEVPEGYTGIYTKEDLDNIRIDFSGKYILMNDLTFEEADFQKGGDFYNGGKGWEPISTTYSSSSFSGTLDGNGYSISNLYINDSSSDYKGLFGKAYGATIKNLTLKNVDITGKDDVGGICGYSGSGSTISYCSVSGEVSGANYVGGICGEQYGGSSTPNNIDYCCNSASVTATGNYVGGITGFGDWYSGYNHNNKISNSMNCGKISGTSEVGGICGNSYASISYCVSTGEVSGSSYVGGIRGEGTVSRCYYLEEAVVNPTCTAGIAKSEDQLRKRATFEGWNFDTVWTMGGRADYPYPELQKVPLFFAEDFNHQHEYTAVVTTEPTHLTEGVMTYTCACGDSYTEAIPKTTEHSYTAVKTAPTCTEKGYTTFTCACGDSYIGDYVEATGHSDSNNDGKCDRCGASVGTHNPSENCSCKCHKSGFEGFIWKISLFFYKIFKTHKTCACGISHY